MYWRDVEYWEVQIIWYILYTIHIEINGSTVQLAPKYIILKVWHNNNFRLEAGKIKNVVFSGL